MSPVLPLYADKLLKGENQSSKEIDVAEVELYQRGEPIYGIGRGSLDLVSYVGKAV